ncbi:SLBB domain-containing protein [Flavobacterium sp.]|uniref:SLBB domain-containing protein n=1 Tax=Flavobacterium sp. TaxID=239 RepID=UPI00375365C8
MNFKKIITILSIIFTLLQTSNTIAQDILRGNDLSSVKVDNLSEADISKIKAQLQTQNITIDQAQPMALAKGMSLSEFNKLKSRLANPTSNQQNTKNPIKENDKEANGDRVQEKVYNNKVKDSLNALIFGSELFDNPTLNFEPDLKLATPFNYILGPGDELQISVYGVQEFNASIPVSVEGKITIQYVGQIPVSGMTIEAATQKIKSAIARVYSTVNSGQSQVSVTLSRIRTIKITLVGSKQPGNYNLSSLATVYNALHLGGGPNKNGSYRNIQLIRNNKIIRNIDVYRFLVNGDQSDNIGLKENDVIKIPANNQKVILDGEVNRPGIFEMKKGESFNDLLNFASGFNEFAYTQSVSVIQKTGKEFKVDDVKSSQFDTYKPSNGDVFKVSKILNRFENRIEVLGSVFRPDIYSFYQGMRIKDLIEKADGIKEDAYLSRSTIVRLKSDLTTEIINLNLEKALAGDPEFNILLKREDIVTVYSILDFKEEFKVTIDGEIKKPGSYDFYENLTLNDLLIQAGGLAGSASKRVEIARMIKAENIDDKNPSKAELFNIEITPENNEQIENFVLKPFDVINIRRVGMYNAPEMVSVSGSVAYTGKYVLVNKKETIYNIIQRAGGLTAIANLDGVKIKRPIQKKQIEEIENINLNLGKNDTIQDKLTKKLKVDLKYATIPVDWRKILKNKNGYDNVTLFPGDEIDVSMNVESVKITGNVLLTSEIPFVKGKSFNYYLNAVGGLDNKGWKKRAYIIYPNGKADVANSFLFFRSYPKVVSGSQIVVPERPTSNRLSVGEWVGIGSVITSLSLLLITAFK